MGFLLSFEIFTLGGCRVKGLTLNGLDGFIFSFETFTLGGFRVKSLTPNGHDGFRVEGLTPIGLDGFFLFFSLLRFSPCVDLGLKV